MGQVDGSNVGIPMLEEFRGGIQHAARLYLTLDLIQGMPERTTPFLPLEFRRGGQ